uniref:Odorant-binding protein 31 n=1 Tax=Encarsia formosa TaxID=32400 RepID=A0A514TU12_ENCFO|nr:odorant-binding protein 31 [Encarsia formosa]
MANFILALYVLSSVLFGQELIHYSENKNYYDNLYHDLSENFYRCFNGSHFKSTEEFRYKLSYDSKARCVLACALQKDKIMIDDDVDKYEALKELRYAVKKQDRENVVKILYGCIDKAESNPDVCNKAYEVVKCSYRKFKILMKNPEKPIVQQQIQD